MNKELNINSKKELETLFRSFTNMVNNYCTRPSASYSTLINSTYDEVFSITRSFGPDLLKYEREEVNAILSKFNNEYRRFTIKRHNHLSTYKKKYRY